jgi:hypothetical protein
MAEKRNHVITVKPEGYHTLWKNKWKEHWHWSLEKKFLYASGSSLLHSGIESTKEKAIQVARKWSDIEWESEKKEIELEKRTVVIEQ